MGCCGSKGSAKNQENERRKYYNSCFDMVQTVYPSMTAVFLMNASSGEVLADRTLDGSSSAASASGDAEVRLVVLSLRKAAQQFSAQMGVTDAPVMRIQGSTHVFVCYSVGAQHVLAVYALLRKDRKAAEDQPADIKQAVDTSVAKDLEWFDRDAQMERITVDILRYMNSDPPSA
eukprot:ANDGO_05642.mRNA.1 hypothetical protein